MPHKGGEVLEVDYAGMSVPITNPETGEIHEAVVFVATLPASNYTYAEIQPLLEKHCTECHAAKPSHAEFTAPPLGLVLTDYDHASAAAPKIKAMAVDSEVMPLGNISGMTKEEREKLGAWIAAGTPK